MGVLGTILLLCVGASSDVAARGLTRQPTSQTQGTTANPPPATTVLTPGRGSQPGQPAQGGPSKPWWQDDAIKKDLGLTAKQLKNIDQLYEADRAKLSQLSTDWHQQETELNRIIRDGGVDEKVISLKLDMVEASRIQFNKIRTLMLYRMYRVMTPEQNKKLQAIQDEMRGRRGGGAFH